MKKEQHQLAGERLWRHREQFRQDISSVAALLAMFREWFGVRSGEGEWPDGVTDFAGDHVLAAAESLARQLHERTVWIIGETDPQDADYAPAEYAIALTGPETVKLRELADAAGVVSLDDMATSLARARLAEIAAAAAGGPTPSRAVA